MRPLFSVHAGEYLAGSYVEENLSDTRVWIPSKDTGIDLLVTNSECTRCVPLQVKFSKDFLPGEKSEVYQSQLVVCTWFKFSRHSIEISAAQYWVLVLYPFRTADTQFLVLRPSELLKKISAHHGNKNEYDLYFWVTAQRTCWETRGLREKERRLAMQSTIAHKSREFTEYLNAWQRVEGDLRA